MKYTIALAQIDPVLGDLKANIDKHVEIAAKARDKGAQLVIFPELSLTGYSVKDLNWELAINPSSPPGAFAPLLKVSSSISILAGGIEEDASFSMFNAAFYLEEGSMRSVHRKCYLPTYGMFEEMRYFSRGKTVRAHDTKLGRIGVLICEDFWHPTMPYLLCLDGASAVLGLVASPTRVGPGKEQLEVSQINRDNYKSYGRLFSTYFAICNRVGYEDGVNFWGGSVLVGPDGEAVCEGRLLEEDLVLGVVDDQETRRARRFSRHFLDEDLDLAARELNRIRGSVH